MDKLMLLPVHWLEQFAGTYQADNPAHAAAAVMMLAAIAAALLLSAGLFSAYARKISGIGANILLTSGFLLFEALFRAVLPVKDFALESAAVLQTGWDIADKVLNIMDFWRLEVLFEYLVPVSLGVLVMQIVFRWFPLPFGNKRRNRTPKTVYYTD